MFGLNGCLKFEPKFLMAFSAPLATMYTPKIEVEWSLEHHGGGG
jgi:hypothetical protein